MSGLYNNRLLASLSPEDLGILGPLDSVNLPRRRVLEAPDQTVDTIYFPEAGLISMVMKGVGGRHVEVGIIGREGMSGMSYLMGSARPPTETCMQVSGYGHSMPAARAAEAMAASASIRACFLGFFLSLATQTSATALAHAKSTVEERLARWLLMADDRMASSDVPLTHEFLAMMLGVRRSGITVAMQRLRDAGLIAVKPGIIHIADREGLIGLCRGSYLKPGALVPEGNQDLMLLNAWPPEGAIEERRRSG